MSEYIVEESPSVEVTDYLGAKHSISHFKQREEIVRCGDCRYYYEAEEYHPQGNYNRRCCKYFDAYDNEVEPDGFCAWGERKAELLHDGDIPVNEAFV